VIVEEDFERWTAKRKAALVMDINQGKISIAEASRSYDLPPSEINFYRFSENFYLLHMQLLLKKFVI